MLRKENRDMEAHILELHAKIHVLEAALIVATTPRP